MPLGPAQDKARHCQAKRTQRGFRAITAAAATLSPAACV